MFQAPDVNSADTSVTEEGEKESHAMQRLKKN